MSAPRILMISNRLPVTVKENGKQFTLQPSGGGLATGLGSFYREYGVVWLGWPGQVSRENYSRVEAKLQAEYDCQPVFLSDRLVEKYYEGFSNRVIWPLFHSFQSFAKFSASEWEAYREANQKFLQALERIYRPGDKIWVHDYQLLLLPGLIRERFPDATVGIFLHIPFPNYDMLRLLPQHKTILRSLMTADLVGFHTHDYMQGFLESVRRLFGLESQLGQFIVGDRVVRAGVFPMGIDFQKFSSTADSVEGQPGDLEIKKGIGDSRLIFSVSRLDYTKGIPQALESFELLLEKQPELCGKVVYLLSVVPSREKVALYASLKREIDELVGRINSRFGSLEWTPIRYLYRNLSFEELISLYKNSHIAWVTPLRDGMNLIAKEYVAARNDEKGILILSEMAGAAKELVEAITVNPNSREDMVEALAQALNMSEEEQTERMRAMRAKCSEHHVRRWAELFTQRMLDTESSTRALRAKQVAGENRANLLRRAAEADRRLFVLDYDGTLMPIMGNPAWVKPDANLLELLAHLGSDTRNEVVILSGRDRATLDQWLGMLPVTLVAEHGAWYRASNGEWQSGYEGLSRAWKLEVRTIIESFVESIPGSRIEEKEYSLVWHYRQAEPESSSVAAKDLLNILMGSVGTLGVQVLPGKKTIEVRSLGVGKGIFFSRKIDSSLYDLIFAAGDDFTDEELFGALPEKAFSVRVGRGFSRASYYVGSFQELRELLREVVTRETHATSGLVTGYAGKVTPLPVRSIHI